MRRVFGTEVAEFALSRLFHEPTRQFAREKSHGQHGQRSQQRGFRGRRKIPSQQRSARFADGEGNESQLSGEVSGHGVSGAHALSRVPSCNAQTDRPVQTRTPARRNRIPIQHEPGRGRRPFRCDVPCGDLSAFPATPHQHFRYKRQNPPLRWIPPNRYNPEPIRSPPSRNSPDLEPFRNADRDRSNRGRGGSANCLRCESGEGRGGGPAGHAGGGVTKPGQLPGP
jgi:hypothetical protein